MNLMCFKKEMKKVRNRTLLQSKQDKQEAGSPVLNIETDREIGGSHRFLPIELENETQVKFLSTNMTLWVGPFPSSLRKHNVQNTASHTGFHFTQRYFLLPPNKPLQPYVRVCVCVHMGVCVSLVMCVSVCMLSPIAKKRSETKRSIHIRRAKKKKRDQIIHKSKLCKHEYTFKLQPEEN